MDVKSRRDREFNKRVRDVVSRDTTKLRETCDKYDKECAERIAEIHHMQEKVRYSMRSLAMDKIHISQATSKQSVPRHHRRSSESTVHSHPNKNTRKLGNVTMNKLGGDNEDGKQTRRDANEFSKRHRASVTSISCKPRGTLDIPSQWMTNRRASSYAGTVSPGSPKVTRQEIPSNACLTGTQSGAHLRPAMSSSYPTDNCMPAPQNLNKMTINTKVFSSQPRSTETSNLLSVNDMRMSAKSPVINLRRKSADSNSEVRRTRRVSENPANRPFIDRDCSPNRLRAETLPGRQRSTSVSHIPDPHITRQTKPRKLSGTGQKVQLFRTRSNSLPDLLSPDSISIRQQNGSAEDIITVNQAKGWGTSKSIQVSRSQTKLDEAGLLSSSPLARSFEEIRHCRYLRCSDTDI